MPKALPAVLAQILFLLCEIWKILRRIFFGGVRGYPKSSKRSFNNPWSNGSWDHSLVSDADNDKAQLPFCLHFYVFVGVFLNLNSTPDSESREGCHDGMCTHTHTPWVQVSLPRPTEQTSVISPPASPPISATKMSRAALISYITKACYCSALPLDPIACCP